MSTVISENGILHNPITLSHIMSIPPLIMILQTPVHYWNGFTLRRDLKIFRHYILLTLFMNLFRLLIRLLVGR